MNAPAQITSLHPVVREKTLSELEYEFRDDCAERYDTIRRMADGDVLALDQIAQILADAVKAIEPIVRKLDMAIERTDARGFARAVMPFKAADVDAYAVCEAIFWNRLSGSAEGLLKGQLAAAVIP